MDCVGLAGLRDQRDGDAAPDGSGADLCAPLRPLHLVGIAGEDDLDAPDLNGTDGRGIGSRRSRRRTSAAG